jgi:hypothetical protein
METTVEKAMIIALKNDIKKAVEEQQSLKNFRKTVNFKGSLEERRKMEPSKAAYKHLVNREKLRVMYATYGLMRGKSFEQIEKRSDTTEPHPLIKFSNQITKLREHYFMSVMEVVEK